MIIGLEGIERESIVNSKGMINRIEYFYIDGIRQTESEEFMDEFDFVWLLFLSNNILKGVRTFI